MEQPDASLEGTSTAIDKALAVLFHLHAQPTPLGVSELGRALGLPKSSTHRLLHTLGRHRLVEQDEAGRYRPGIALVALGLGVLEREPVVTAARPVIEAEARALAETIFVCALRGDRLVVLDKAEGTGFLRAAPKIGEAVPLHATAIGRLHLAFAPERVDLGAAPLERFTPHTRTRPAEVRRAVDEALRRGWAANREEWIPGLHVVAAPILVRGRLEATLALAAPVGHFDASAEERVGKRLVAAARSVAERLEGRSGRVREERSR